MTTADDAELLRRYWETKSQEAFAELVRRHVDGIYSSVLRRVGRDAHLAEDVTQRVFARLALKAEQLVGHAYLTGWLYQCARIESANLVRSERRRKAREEAAAMNPEDNASNASIDWGRLSPFIDEAIDQLNARDRTAVLLRFIDQKGYAEIGRELAVTEDAARMRVERALERLQSALARRGITSTATVLGLAMSQHVVLAAPTSVANSALAMGTAGTASASLGGTAVFFMSAQKSLTLTLASVALLASLGTVYWSINQRAAAEQAWAEESKRGTAQQAELAALNTQVGEKASEVSRLEREAAAAMANREEPPPVWDAVKEGEAFLARHPEVRQSMNEQQDAATRFRYREILSALPSEAAERFLVAMRGGSARGIPAGPNGEMMMLRSGQIMSPAERPEEIRQIIGDALYADYQKIAGLNSTQPIISKLAGALVFSDTPMSVEQAQSVQEALRSTPRMKLEGANIKVVDWNAVLAKTASVLNLAQQAQLRLQADREIASRASMLRLNSVRTSTASGAEEKAR